MLIQLPSMVPTILHHTPTWVWALLVALTALGVSQLVARRASHLRVTLMPAAMAAFALIGLTSAFRGAGTLGVTVAAWLLAALGSNAVVSRCWPDPQPGTRYDRATQLFELPGSGTPLLLILGIFLTKYVVGVALALQPTLAADSGFAIPVAALYGVFSGIFASRLFRLLRLARVQGTAPQWS
jgi:hypothetical protein